MSSSWKTKAKARCKYLQRALLLSVSFQLRFRHFRHRFQRFIHFAGVFAARLCEIAELEFHIRPDDELHGTGSGYVVDCLRSARLALCQNSYRDTIKTAIAFGNDTDTTAYVAGGIAGLKWGMEAIPDAWLHALREREKVEKLLLRL